MTAEDKIKDLQKEIDRLRRSQASCNHRWGESIYDPEKKLVSDDRAGYETHGSDRWARPSFHEESVDRWSRKCLNCGKVEYTYVHQIISVNKKPKFR